MGKQSHAQQIIYPFPNFNVCTVVVREWMSNFFPHFTMDVIYTVIKVNISYQNGSQWLGSLKKYSLLNRQWQSVIFWHGFQLASKDLENGRYLPVLIATSMLTLKELCHFSQTWFYPLMLFTRNVVIWCETCPIQFHQPCWYGWCCALPPAS